MKFDSSDVKTLDRSIRITAKDIEYFGYSDRCPKCADLQAGLSKTQKLHTDECRLRMYLCYETSDHPKWQNVRHWFEDEHAVTKDNIDAEGSPATPKPD